jgi:PAS domain S-box-containing protein
MGAEVNRKPTLEGQEGEQKEPINNSVSLLKLNKELQRVQARLENANLRLAENSKRYQTLFNRANDIVFVHGITDEGLPSNFTEVNDKACKALGYTRKEFLKLGPMDIVPPRRVGNTPAVMKKIFTDKNVLFDSFLLTKDGSEIPVEVNAHLFELDGSRTILSICRDITERNRSEEEIRRLKNLHESIIDESPAIIEVVDRDFVVKAWNKFAEDYVNIKKEDIVGKLC